MNQNYIYATTLTLQLSWHQPEEELTVAFRKPNVSSEVRPDHFELNSKSLSWCKEIQKP